MQIVIDIPEDVYYNCMTSGYCRYAVAFSKEMAYSVRNGVVLPKDHGGLIDADTLCELASNNIEHTVDANDIMRMPVIIPRAKGGNDK